VVTVVVAVVEDIVEAAGVTEVAEDTTSSIATIVIATDLHL
jgi:hypothetical protein